MKIYVGHASSFDYVTELYQLLKKSKLWGKHTFILPHEIKTPIFSKDVISNCDLFLAEVSYPSIGLGIELGWADVAGRKILCLHKKNVTPSSSIELVCSSFISYDDAETMIDKLSEWIKLKY